MGEKNNPGVTLELTLEEWVDINSVEEGDTSLTNPREQPWDGRKQASYGGLKGVKREGEGCTTALERKALHGPCNPE